MERRKGKRRRNIREVLPAGQGSTGSGGLLPSWSRRDSLVRPNRGIQEDGSPRGMLVWDAAAVPGAAGRRQARFGSCWVCAGYSGKVPVMV